MRWAAGLVWAMALPAMVWAQAAEQPRTIAVSGQAQVNVVPDEVVVQVGVETYARDLDAATRANAEASARLVKAIKAMGVEDKHLQTDHLTLDIRYPNGGPEAGIEGYLARRGLMITLKKTEDFEKLIETALKNGANRLMGHTFRTTELRKHRDTARALAMKAALEKARALAKELECTIGDPRSVSEHGGYYWDGGGWGNSYMAQNTIQDAGGRGDAPEGETTRLGQIGVYATVQVTFDLKPLRPDAAKAP